jgi:microcystin degradation protein MlrC
MRIAVARLWFEGNRFAPGLTDAACFARREWLQGQAALERARDTATELAAVAALQQARPDWDIQVLRCASAEPGPPIDDAVFETWLKEVLEGLAGLQPDGVYLSLHGAAITAHCESPDLTLVQRVRAQIGASTPLVASFDLHGNLPPQMADLLDFATVYRCYPHTDMRETAERALDVLCQRLEGRSRPVGCLLPLGQLVPSFNMRTAQGPMAELQALARSLEARPDTAVFEVGVFGGFPYADTPDTGASVMAWAWADEAPERAPAFSVGATHDRGADHVRTETRRQIHHAAHTVLNGFRERLPRFEPQLCSPDEGIDQALSCPEGLVAVTDPGDNPASGGVADTPTLFARLLALRRTVGHAVNRLPAGSIWFAFFADPDLVARCRTAGEGATLTVQLGGQRDTRFGPPVAAQAQVVRLTEGRFINEGPMERGAPVDAGGSVVIDIDGLRVIVTQAVVFANDPAFFRLHGLGFEQTRLLCVKAKNHFRGAFESLCVAIIDVDCPGPAAADLSSLPFRHRPAHTPSTAV